MILSVSGKYNKNNIIFNYNQVFFFLLLLFKLNKNKQYIFIMTQVITHNTYEIKI